MKKINLLPGHELITTQCPCPDCDRIGDSFDSETYPCARFIKEKYLPDLSEIRYTTASELLAEGYTEGKRFIAYSSKRGTMCFVQETSKWKFICLDTFGDLDAHFMDVDTDFSPAMCLRSLKNELKSLHLTPSTEENIVHLLVDDIDVLYLKALKDEVTYLEGIAF